MEPTKNHAAAGGAWWPKYKGKLPLTNEKKDRRSAGSAEEKGMDGSLLLRGPDTGSALAPLTSTSLV